MPDDRRAWHRGGACLFNGQPVTARAHDLTARGIDVPRWAGYAETCGAIRFAIAPYVL